MAAQQATLTLTRLEWAPADIAAVAHAIEAHSFSAGIPPQTLEARILQDADRLDAIGLIGVARCFYIGGRMRSALYDAADPRAEHRQYDDKRFSLITSKPSCSNCKTASRPPPGGTWPSCAPNACDALSTICWKRCNVGLPGIFVMPITFSVT